MLYSIKVIALFLIFIFLNYFAHSVPFTHIRYKFLVFLMESCPLGADGHRVAPLAELYGRG